MMVKQLLETPFQVLTEAKYVIFYDVVIVNNVAGQFYTTLAVYISICEIFIPVTKDSNMIGETFTLSRVKLYFQVT